MVLTKQHSSDGFGTGRLNLPGTHLDDAPTQTAQERQLSRLHTSPDHDSELLL